MLFGGRDRCFDVSTQLNSALGLAELRALQHARWLGLQSAQQHEALMCFQALDCTLERDQASRIEERNTFDPKDDNPRTVGDRTERAHSLLRSAKE